MAILPLAMPARPWQALMMTQSDAPPAVRREEKTPPVRRAGLVAWVCLFIVWVVWGSTYLAIRVGIETMPPLLMAAARNLVAGIIMFPAAVFSSRRRGASRRGLAGLAPLAGLALGLVGVGFLAGLGGGSGHTSAAGVVIILIVAFTWALGTLMTRRVTIPSSPALATPTVATYAYVNPVIAVLLGTLILNERLTPAMLGGGVLIVGAVVLVVRRSPPPH